MKICFIVSCINSKSKGNGGHYHSLVTMCRALSVNNDVFIINVGTLESNPINKEKVKVYNLIAEGFNFFNNLKTIQAIIKSEQPEIINAFDHFGFFWARILGKKMNIPFTLTKCGGSNPKYYFPYAKYLFLYSKENSDFFTQQKKFKNTELFLIPNRVFAFESSQERIKNLFIDYPIIQERKYKFLRICRIGNMYKHSVYQLINLVERINHSGFDALAVVIGIVEDETVFNELKSFAKNKNVLFVNDDKYIKNAKELIGFSDFVLGTGRSFMEAASQGKIMLAPICNSEIPVLINTDNIDEVMNFNFSERLKLKDFDENENYQKILELFNDSKALESNKQFISETFNDRFNIESVVEKYIRIYKDTKICKEHYLDLLVHFVFTLKEYKFKF